MTRLQDQKVTPGSPVAFGAFGHGRNTDQINVILPELEEKSFEEKVREWYPTHHDIRKRPR